jgi:dienelactone hydrolase
MKHEFDEYEVTFSADARYPISGTLTVPRTERPPAAVVLVHGSGRVDRNETVGANYPFKEIAEGLAERGIAVLRYDKRTYTYNMPVAESADITVDAEATDDAEAAIRFLRGDGRVDGDGIYLLGHSLGAGLLSYIGKNEPVKGYIVMAGTLKTLWEVIIDQNLAALAENPEFDTPELREQLDAETKKTANLAEMSDEDAKNTVLFGLPATYLRSLERINAPELHLADDKPVIVLHGGRDRQAFPEYFEQWKAALAAHPNAEFILYPELNHLFGEYAGEPLPYLQLSGEYDARTPIHAAVLNDVAGFIARGQESKI